MLRPGTNYLISLLYVYLLLPLHKCINMSEVDEKTLLTTFSFSVGIIFRHTRDNERLGE